MARYRNTGATIPRTDQPDVVRGEVFEPTERELRQCAYKLERVDEPEWPLETEPSDYLERWPDGPKADLAREVLDVDA